MRGRKPIDITKRFFLKATISAAAASCLPTRLVTAAYGLTKTTVRDFKLSASRSKFQFGAGPTFWAWTYNGQVPGPEIRVKEGERIRILLSNYLPEETSIHWHGVPVPNRMDGVPGVTQNGVMPGKTFHYEFEAKPAGTYIYHSHARYQLDQGLYGPLIYSVNGRLYPHMDPLLVKKGERIKMRLMNPSSATIYDLQLAGHSMTVTHTDGRPISPLKTDILRIGMGERYDVEFMADNPGSWLLAARETGFGEGQLRISIR